MPLFILNIWLLLEALILHPKLSLTGLWWLLLGKKVRGKSRLLQAIAQSKRFYPYWIRQHEPRMMAAYCNSARLFEPGENLVCIILYELGQDCDQAALSVKAAFGDAARIICCDRAEHDKISVIFAGLTQDETVHWLLPISATDRLSDRLAQCIGTALSLNDPDVIFWDEDNLQAGRRHSAWFKPAWDPTFARACDMLRGSAIYSRSALQTLAMFHEENGQSILPNIGTAVLARAGHFSIDHIPFPLTHRTNPAASPVARLATQQRLSLQTQFLNDTWHYTADPSMLDTIIARPPAPSVWPKVSILIPTRDRAELLDMCLSSLKQTIYPGDIEIIVIDNGSTDAEALALLAKIAADGTARVIPAPGPFNFSTLNNLASDQASGELLCLLNNDIEVIAPDWLSAMVRHALQSGVGAVGAKLLYPDGTIQHCGVAIGMGNAAGHIQRGIAEDEPINFSWHGITRQVSAVTAACLVVSKANYAKVGGLDEATFAVAFNDVDFCLRLDQAGLRNIYCAEARLIHHESKSRGNDYAPENRARFDRELKALQSRWGTQGYLDKWYSPYFTKHFETQITWPNRTETKSC